MPKCVLHVGMHKTGTTSIQNSLNNYEDDTFFYARLAGDANHSVPIYSLFSATPEKHYLNRVRVANGTLDRYIASVWEGLQASIERAGERTVIISGEDIAILPEDAIERLAEYFKQHFSSTQVLAYIRPPMSFINSAFQQTVRSGRRTELNLTKLYRNYRGSFEKFDRNFGRENVLLKIFERKELVGGDSVLDFCSTIGLDFPPEKIKRANESSTKEFITLVFQYNRYCEEMGYDHLAGSEAHRLNEVLKGLGSTKFAFAPDLLRGVLEQNADDIRWIEERIGRKVDDSATAAASPGDVKSEEDLLQPVPGARDLLLKELSRSGAQGPDELDRLSDIELFHRLRESVKGMKIRQIRMRPGQGRLAQAGAGRAAAKAARGGAERPGAGKRKEAALEARRAARAEAQQEQPVNPKRQAKLRLQQEKQAQRDLKAAKTAVGVRVLDTKPRPLINDQKNMLVYWSPKCACTTIYAWFAQVSGFVNELPEYGRRLHRHRLLKYYSSELFTRSARADLQAMKRLKIIRDPYIRAVSIYRHALKTGFADPGMAKVMDEPMNASSGFSFNQFLDYVEKHGVWNCDVHVQPQYRERELEFPPTRFINISKTDLFAGLNAFEEELGLVPTKFTEMEWLHDLEGTRKAKQNRAEGEALDDMAFTRAQVKDEDFFPSYEQLLTPRARARIEAIYKVDFDAYRDHL